ncbi:porin family protein [Massilia agri]|uniref:Porin family protein n=1 Tax=Massilia agri TaxID=1886785 RepID=A0ABT2AQ78_9BURK|nr:porin family protein [Massilia agri]MCS0597873.1 porin family protein [Massilia agri]
MHVKAYVFVAGLFAIGAQAQQLESEPIETARLSTDAKGRFGPLAEGFKRYEPLYGGNEAGNPNDRQFTGFRTDPRLVLGYAFTRNFAIEAGYSHLRDRGFHKIEPGPVDQALAAGALGVKSNTTYVAAKLTVPLSERLNAYGKFGIAHSQVKNDGLLPPGATMGGEPLGTSGKGAYGAIGAQFKVNERTTIKAEARSNGSASKFDSVSNASGLRGSVGIGF